MPKQLAQRLLSEVFEAGHLALADALCTPPVAAEVKLLAASMRAPFPDLRFTVEHLVGEGTRAACTWVARGTQTRPFQTIPATGAAVAWSGLIVITAQAGRVVSFNLICDNLSLLHQLRVALRG